MQMIGRALAKPLVIIAHCRQVRVLEWRFEPSVDRQANGDVGQGELATSHVGTGVCQLAVENAHVARPVRAAGGQGLWVLVGGRVPDQRHERVAPRTVEVRGLPVDPLVDPGPRLRLARVEPGGAITRGQVADDAVGFPQGEVAILDHRDHGIGVQRKELGAVRGLEARPPVFALERDLELGARPQNFSYIDGGGSTQYP